MKQEHKFSNEELKQLYLMLASEQPSQALDEAILAQAKQSCATLKLTKSDTTAKSDTAKSDKVVFLSQYRWPISTAASVLLISSLFLLNSNQMHKATLTDALPILQESVQDSAPAMEAQMMSTAAPKAARQMQKSLAATETSNATLSEDVEIVASDKPSFKQQLKQLEQLVEDKQWVEADKLLKRIQQQHPELLESQHPQYKQWQALTEQIAAEQIK